MVLHFVSLNEEKGPFAVFPDGLAKIVAASCADCHYHWFGH
jgi:hypothetical protein